MMELFTVIRYDETKLTENDEKAQEELILKQLQSRQEKKKRLRTVQAYTENFEITDQSLKTQNGIVTLIESPHKLSIEEASTDAPIELKSDDPAEERSNSTTLSLDQGDVTPKLVEKSVVGGKTLGDFIVLGGEKQHRLQKTDQVLAPWLSHPTIIERDLSLKGASVKKQGYLDQTIKNNLRSMGYKRLFPVQEKVIPWIIDAHQKPSPFWPRDVCISSPTGSGKTLAFAVPIVQLLLKRIAPAVRALVILPVQELAEQVYTVFRKLCIGTNICPVVLSRRLLFESEQKNLVKYCNGEYIPKVDIVITTAGRLVEHLHSTKGFTLSQLRFLIVDEADQVMNQIQNDWLYNLDKHVKQESDEYLLGRTTELFSQSELFDKDRQPHKLLFSATFKRDTEKLKALKLFHPKLFTTVNDTLEITNQAQHVEQLEQQRGKFAGQYTTPLELKELVCVTHPRAKPLTLYALIRENDYRKFLVFTNGIDASHRLSFVLQRLFGTDIIIEEWSSSLSPAERQNVLSRFSMGKVNGIICTDALARGIDIENIEVVISYDMPRHIDTYIHRIGRTARAGNRGTSITMLLENEKKKFNTLLKEANKQELQTVEIKSTTEEEFAAKYSSALNDLREALELESEVMKKIRNGISIGSMTKVNLLTKLKNQVDIAYSTEIIKSLKYLPKSWTNEAIEIRALEQAKKERQKYKPVKPGDIPVAVSSNTSTNIDAAGESNSCKKIVKEGYEPGSDTVADGFDSEAASGTNEVTTIETNGKKLKKMKQRKRKLSDDLANLSNARNDSTIEDHGIEPKVKRIQKKTLASTCDGSDLKRVSVKEKKQRWRKLKQVLDNKAVV